MNKKVHQISSTLGVVMFLVLFGFYFHLVSATPVLPSFDAENFSNSTKIDNPWLSLPVGSEFEYEGETEDGTEIVKIEITGEIKDVMGIKTLVYRDRVYVQDELVEDTRDYLAQDDDGNVWYFGEDVDNYKDGKLSDHDGSWLAGEDGALPGYWMPANPTVGYEYRQEYYEGEAEDVGEVVSLSATVKNKLATYTNCLKTKDTNPLEPAAPFEYKYYCKQVGALVLEEKPEEVERVELVDFEFKDSAVAAKMQTLINLLNQLIALLKLQLLN